MSLVVLGERVHRAHGLTVQVDEGKRVVALDPYDLLQVAVPQLQEPLAILRQEPVRLLVVGRIVRAALPPGVAPVHHLGARHETELLTKVFRPEIGRAHV